ncbi:MAG: tetratricopeptide repeat protein [Saprospiraceae bacterium]|nr:tetratricopeptide repeat protein [Saprospiraceae bacterium]MDG2417808.1 tetratricopeptide repeat protein [Saprospiraceae bacterium]
MRILLIILLAFSYPLLAQGQPRNNDSKLAQQYFADGEFEKASVLYKRLFSKNNRNDYYLNRFMDCMLSLEKYSEAEKVIKKQLKKNPKQVQLYVTYGNIYERQYKDDEAVEQYEKAIKKMPADRFSITRLANAFINLTKYELAIQTYEKGANILKDQNIFAYNLGDLYRRKGDTEKMILNYLNSLAHNPNRLNSMKTLFQRYLSEDDFLELQTQLYTRIQDNDEVVAYPELLTWVFIQKKDYKNALRQVKALDRRLKENGGRIYRLAEIAANDKDYDAAIVAYNYIVREKGKMSSYYIESKRESLTCKRKKLVEGFDYTDQDLKTLEAEYQFFLNEFGKRKSTASIVAELADLEAFYLNDLDKAILLLQEMIEYRGLNRYILAKGKLSLADFYLMKGEVWESTLLYSQVDKEFKDDILGHEARFRNAKLSYYSGDYQWAQAQFDILKASTSKLIANDALDLSIFIMDNLGLDTIATPIMMYSNAELLVFQNRFEDAFIKLDSLQTMFPGHTLQDDMLYLEANILVKKREYQKAETIYQKIINEHLEEIRADNAMFELANLYENQLNNLEKAQALYERIFIDFSGSTFAVESRKRFRKLRGDTIQ